MPFIGQQPVTGAYHKLDAITTSATATYNLLLNGGAYSPASANHLLVSLNGVMQAPQDSFTVSGSTITFASALTSSDSIDFIMALGDVLSIGTPSDGTVTAAKIATNAVTTAKLASGAIGTTELGTGLDLSGKVTTGYETLSTHVVTAEFGGVGFPTGAQNVTVGTLTIPSPGIWRVEGQFRLKWTATTYFGKMFLSTTTNSLTGEIGDHSSGGSANTAVRMIYERVGNNSFANLLVTPSWIIDVPTGLTSGDTIYFIMQASASDAGAAMVNDINGQQGGQAIKIAETTTSGTTITARHF